MKASMKTAALALGAALVVTGCVSNPSQPGDHQNTQRGAILGAVGGAVLGNVVAGDGKRTQGAAIGAAVGAAAGGLIGRQMDQQEAELRRQMVNTGVEIERQGDTLRLVAPEAITFDTAEAVVKPQFAHALQQIAASVQQHPGTIVQIEGHTDSVGRDDYNQRLSEHRANSVRTALIQEGVPAGRIVAVGYGKSRPIADNTTAQGRSLNRRVEILIIPQG